MNSYVWFRILIFCLGVVHGLVSAESKEKLLIKRNPPISSTNSEDLRPNHNQNKFKSPKQAVHELQVYLDFKMGFRPHQYEPQGSLRFLKRDSSDDENMEFYTQETYLKKEEEALTAIKDYTQFRSSFRPSQFKAIMGFQLVWPSSIVRDPMELRKYLETLFIYAEKYENILNEFLAIPEIVGFDISNRSPTVTHWLHLKRILGKSSHRISSPELWMAHIRIISKVLSSRSKEIEHYIRKEGPLDFAWYINSMLLRSPTSTPDCGSIYKLVDIK